MKDRANTLFWVEPDALERWQRDEYATPPKLYDARPSRSAISVKITIKAKPIKKHHRAA